MPSMDETEVAWAAGLFEGEGTVNWTRGVSPRLSLTSTDEDVVDRLVEVLEIGKKNGPYRHKNQEHKAYWVWSLGDVEGMRTFMATVYPWLLGRRKEQVDRAWDAVKDKQPRGTWRTGQTTCLRGHERVPGTSCKTCNRDRMRARRAQTLKD